MNRSNNELFQAIHDSTNWLENRIADLETERDELKAKLEAVKPAEPERWFVGLTIPQNDEQFRRTSNAYPSKEEFVKMSQYVTLCEAIPIELAKKTRRLLVDWFNPDGTPVYVMADVEAELRRRQIIKLQEQWGKP